MQEVQIRRQVGQRHLLGCRAVPLLLAVFAAPRLIEAQTISPLFVGAPGKVLLCNSEQFGVAKPLSLRQRACWHGSAIVSPWGALWGGFSSGIGQWRNSPYVKGQDGDNYAHRFAVYYARRTARETGELIAGYLNHEDPRFHPSGQTAFGKRVRSALTSVLVTRTDDGSRPALAPIMASLGSAFAGAACYREQTGTGYAFRGASITYGSYFAKAIYREFRPDISFFMNRMLRKGRG
jgi:hypothetical protein